METIPASTNQQFFIALHAAARVIEKLDSKLAAMGQGHDLSKVPAFHGVHFPAFLMALTENIPMEAADKIKWEKFLDENIK